MPIRLSAAIALLCLSATAAQPADQSGVPSRSEMRRACATDYQRLCGDIQLGSGRLRQCFADHASELSPACSDVLKRQAAGQS